MTYQFSRNPMQDFAESPEERGLDGRDSLLREAASAAEEAARLVGNEIGIPYPAAEEARECPRCGETVRRESWRYGYCNCQRDVYDKTHSEYVKSGRSNAVEHHWREANVPKRFVGKRFSNFERRSGTEDALDACLSYAKGFKRGETDAGLVLAGKFGTGKTHLAVSLARELLETSLTIPMFVNTVELLSGIKTGEDGKFDWSLYEQAKTAEFLVVDDLGQENTTPWARETIFTLINHRYQEMLPTVFTSNQGDKRLRETLGGALVSRLYEMSRFVLMQGEDYRRELAG